MTKDTTYLKRIDEIVKQAAVEGTFSLDLLNQIQALMTGFEEQTAKIERLNERIETRNTDIEEYRTINDGLNTELRNWKDKEYALTEGETAVTKRKADANRLQLLVNAANQRVTDHQEMMRTVFKNPVLQRATFESKQVPVTQPGGYQTMMTESNSHIEKQSIE